MRILYALLPIFFGCSHDTIGPDDAGTDVKQFQTFDASDSSSDASGDASGPGDPSFQAGTRLKVRYITGSDGSQVAQGMFDSQRNEACTFATATDKETRCLPDAYSQATLGTVCMDQACTQPVAVVSKGCSSAPIDVRILTSTTATCGAYTYAVATVTGGILAGSTTVWFNSGQTTAATVASNYGADLYATSGVVDPTNFVMGTAVTK